MRARILTDVERVEYQPGRWPAPAACREADPPALPQRLRRLLDPFQHLIGIRETAKTDKNEIVAMITGVAA